MTHKQNPKDRHHHVWQKYLQAWSKDDVIWCRLGDKIFETGTPAIAVERGFYKLHHLTQLEQAYIIALLTVDNEEIIEVDKEFLRELMSPFLMYNEIIKKGPNAEADRALYIYASEELENRHTAIENSFIPLLEKALKGSVEFYYCDYDEEDYNNSAAEIEPDIIFFNYLSTQYVRTKGFKERFIDLAKNYPEYPDISRIWHVLMFMFSRRIGAKFYTEKKRRSLTLITNESDIPFITGDQPAINLFADWKTMPDRMSIYYPISPKLAFLLADVDSDPLYPSNITCDQAMELNARLKAACHSQLFGSCPTAWCRIGYLIALSG